jgi:hypothetical protein
MSDDENPPSPRTLEYERLSPTPRDRLIGQCIAGALFGAFAVFVVGCAGSGIVLPYPGTKGRPEWRAWSAALWFALAIVGAGLTVPCFRRGRMFCAGILMGAAAGALCEGFCYAP